MKLLLITSIQEYENDVKDILRHSGVKSFSYQEVKGFKNEHNGSATNWFGLTDIPTESILFTVFIETSCIDEIFELLEKFNAERTSLSKIHISCIAVDKSI